MNSCTWIAPTSHLRVDVATPTVPWPRATFSGRGRPLKLRRRAPRGTPLRCFPRLAQVDRLAGHPVAPELEDVHRGLPGTAVVADRSLDDPEIPLASQVAHLEAHPRRILAAPFLEVGHALEPLAGLRELEDGVVVVDLVAELQIAADLLPEALDLRPPLGLVHRYSLPSPSSGTRRRTRRGSPCRVRRRCLAPSRRGARRIRRCGAPAAPAS